MPNVVPMAGLGNTRDATRWLPESALLHAIDVGLGLLLLGELLALTISFDTQPLDSIPTVWAQLVNYAPQYLRFASLSVAATLGLAWSRDHLDLSALVAGPRVGARITALAVHGCMLGGFALATATVVAVGASYGAHPAVWTLAWFFTGSATLVSWALALRSPSAWRAVLSQVKRSVASGIALGTLVFSAGYLTEEFWIPLARYTFGLVAWMLALLYPQTVSNPARLLIGTPAFRVIITPQCSGYEGIGLIVAFLAIYLWLSRRSLRFPGALLLLPLGAIVIWLANAVRIVALIAIGSAGWRTVAAGGFHSQAGWIAFNAIALGFVALTNHFGYFRTGRETTVTDHVDTGDESGTTTAYLGPFFVVTATAMLTGAFSAGFDWLYPVRVVAVGAVLWAYRRHYASLRWSYSWWSFAIGFITFVVWLLLIPTDTSRNSGWPAAMQSIPLHWAAAWMLLRVVGYVVTTPVAEELAFRGFLTRRILRPDFQNVPIGVFSWSSFLLSSVLFGAFHASFWLPGTIAGMTFALALYRRRALSDAIWAHATTNGLIALYAIVTGRWWVWS